MIGAIESRWYRQMIAISWDDEGEKNLTPYPYTAQGRSAITYRTWWHTLHWVIGPSLGACRVILCRLAVDWRHYTLRAGRGSWYTHFVCTWLDTTINILRHRRRLNTTGSLSAAQIADRKELSCHKIIDPTAYHIPWRKMHYLKRAVIHHTQSQIGTPKKRIRQVSRGFVHGQKTMATRERRYWESRNDTYNHMRIAWGSADYRRQRFTPTLRHVARVWTLLCST